MVRGQPALPAETQPPHRNMSSLKFVTWNVKGIKNKCRAVLSHLRELDADVCLLQETHLSDASLEGIHLLEEFNIFPAHYNTRKRGVMILIKKNIPFVHNTTIKDPEGRFVIINIFINGQPVTIGNIYGPNEDDPSFFYKLFSSLDKIPHCPIILGGDFNKVIDKSIDRTINSGTMRATEALKMCMSEFGLCDIWRFKHPTAREYSFRSSARIQSQSRLDFFLTSNSIISNITDTHIYPIQISDHAPVSLTWNSEDQHQPNTGWQFNKSLLEDPEFDSYIKRVWPSFLEINDSPKSSALWEMGKAVLREEIIYFSDQKKKKENEQETILQQNTEELVNSNSSNPSEENQIKRNQEKTMIPVIQNSAGQPKQSLQEINDIFRTFYKKLYSENDTNRERIPSFLNSIVIPHLTIEQKETLDSPLTSGELSTALDNIPNDEAPGPDGFPAEFYKHFWPILESLFYQLTSEIQDGLPASFNMATISPIIEPEKDPTLPGSYRPISLLNTDIKIISKALAHRLETVLPSIIHQDQTAFIEGRHKSSNTRRLMDLMHYSSLLQTKIIIVSLDAEKAFDMVNWTFLFATLRKFGFGEAFINLVRTLYTSASAAVLTNSQTSQSFTLHRGTRQGCPLSPSLFNIFIEPLAAAIRKNKHIQGIQTSDTHHKISLYADNILLYLQNPLSSLKKTMRLIESFSQISNYTINWTKSTILPQRLNRSDLKALTPPIPLCPGNVMTYLGIKISPELSKLVQLNITSLLKTIDDDLQRSVNFPGSVEDRIAIVKERIDAKISYLFTMIPSQPSLP